MKFSNLFGRLTAALAFAFASAGASAAVGNVDGITSNGPVLNGWTCLGSGSHTQNGVSVYAGGPYGTGTLVAYGVANAPGFSNSDNAAVNSSCGTTNEFHRFNIPLIKPAYSYSGTNRAMYVYNNDDGTLLSSGTFTLPAQPAVPAGTTAPFYTVTNMLNSGQNTVRILFEGDSHTASYGVSNTQAWIYVLAQKFASTYPTYKVTLYQRSYYSTGGVTYAGATAANGTAECNTGLTDITTTFNPTQSKNLIIIQDGIGGSNLERYMARLSGTAPGGTPTPSGQSVILAPNYSSGVDAVIMMFGANDWMERYTSNGAYACYGGSATLGGGYGTANLEAHGTNGHLGFEMGDPIAQFEYAYYLAANATKGAEYAASGNTVTPFMGFMTPMNPPGLLETSCSAGCSFMPYNWQFDPTKSTTPGWTLNLQSYQDGTYTAAYNVTGTTSTVLDLYSWVALDSTTLIEDAINGNWDIHLNSTGNSDLATIVWNQGFGLP